MTTDQIKEQLAQADLPSLVKLYRELLPNTNVPHSRPVIERLMLAAFTLGTTAQMTQALTHAKEEEQRMHATREDMDDYAKGVAQRAAINEYTVLGAAASPECKPATDATWEPHPWVIDAIKTAYRHGMKQAETDSQFVIEQVADQANSEQIGMVRATVAAVMAYYLKSNVCITIEIPLEDQRTIWDRFELTQTLTPDSMAVAYTLARK